MSWIANTDAKLTFLGEPINPLAPRSAEVTTLAYCSARVNDECGGTCAVYSGGAQCLSTPGTNCLAATNPVLFCSTDCCDSPCTSLTACGVPLDNGFCFTPDTNSILISSA